MKDFASLIKNRRSTRKFTSQLLNPDQVAAILKAGLMSPASKRKNPWQFVVIEDKEMLEKLSLCKPHGAAFLEGCALAVVVLANVMESDVWIEDASIASIMMQLQAEAVGAKSGTGRQKVKRIPPNISADCWISLIKWRCCLS